MMGRYAIIQDGVVVEIVETDGDVTTMFHPDILVVLTTKGVAVGYVYKDGKFYTPKVDHSLTQQAINAQARAYLSFTDWYVVRQLETGLSIPEEILAARAEARTKVIE